MFKKDGEQSSIDFLYKSVLQPFSHLSALFPFDVQENNYFRTKKKSKESIND